jgi:hypothetical protein
MVFGRKRNAIIYVGLSFLILIFGACGGGGGGGAGSGGATPAETTTISGKVIDSNGDPVSGAEVTITSTPVTTYTDSNGDFSVSIEVGDHTITVTIGNSTLYQGTFSASDTSPADLGDLNPTNDFYPMTDADAKGTYLIGNIRVESSTGGVAAALDLEVDGAGSSELTIISDSTGGSGTLSHRYSIAADGGLTVNTGSGRTEKGQLSSDGELFFLVDTDTSDDSIGMTFGVRRSSGMTNADFNGTYMMSQLIIDQPSANLIQITADGSGKFSYQSLTNENSGSATYAVADDGSVTTVGEANAYGQLSYDGSVFLFVDTSSDYPHIAIGIRQSSGMSDTDLSGIYHTAAIIFEDNDTSLFAIARGNLISDGTGHVDVNFSDISGGGTNSSSETGSVSNNGTVTTGYSMPGQLSWDGSLLAFPDTDPESDSNTYFLGIRKP